MRFSATFLVKYKKKKPSLFISCYNLLPTGVVQCGFRNLHGEEDIHVNNLIKMYKYLLYEFPYILPSNNYKLFSNIRMYLTFEY